MIISSFLCFIILLSLFGYSFLYKKIIYKKTKFQISNSEVFYGLLLIIFFALIINFFFPLKFFTLPIISIGFLLFLFSYKNKVFQIKFSYYFYIIFLINFFTYYNGPNVDSPLYHLQTLNWMILNKINLGITNLNIRFGVNSTWHSFIALMNISFSNISLKYYLSSIIFSILSYEIFFKKKFKSEDIFLFLSVSFLLTFALIHPFVNGPILNHLGNPEVDTVAMFLFMFSFYYFIKLYNNNFTDITSSINIFVIIIFFAVTTKLSNISLMFLLLVIIYSNKNYKIINFSNILVGITGLFWLFRSFLISGCFIFPIKTTCINTQWSDLEQTEFPEGFVETTTTKRDYKGFDTLATKITNKISSLVKEAVGFSDDRGDTIVVTSGDFIDELDVITTKWYEQAWFQNMVGQLSTVLILAIITFGALKPLLNRILVPSGAAEAIVTDSDLEKDTEEEVEVQEGESLEDIKAKLKPKKSSISPEMLDTANTYDDKVAVVRMLVGDEAGKISNVFRQLLQKDGQ